MLYNMDDDKSYCAIHCTCRFLTSCNMASANKVVRRHCTSTIMSE